MARLKPTLVELRLLRHDVFLRKVGCVTQLWRNPARQAMAHHGPSIADPSRRRCVLRFYTFVRRSPAGPVSPRYFPGHGALSLRLIAVSIWSASAIVIPPHFYTYVR